ncbi:MAG: hypothetical protein IBX50_07690 [Marinospirillum sp.]|uniref:DotH/IcmK family type IV secretion protein n=1 Tax=Marinospirillum sp. TaxID=2183934 RepID=UPI0019DC4395|nr:DotH/IcmK family type IV secretion protein [Marinospirillum sp.]MBE0506589.1 hypothetical protein [Marinospirillum sp.]
MACLLTPVIAYGQQPDLLDSQSLVLQAQNLAATSSINERTPVPSASNAMVMPAPGTQIAADPEVERLRQEFEQRQQRRMQADTASNAGRNSGAAGSNQQRRSASSSGQLQEADQLLIQGLAAGGFDQAVRQQLGDGLTPEEIRRFREMFTEYEAARNNPAPPPTRSEIRMVEPGQTIDILVMRDFPSTLMLADQFGDPLSISYHDLGAGSVVEVREIKGMKGDQSAVDGLRIHALKPMRSTALTVLTADSRIPVNITIRTVPADGETEVVLLNELRLGWVSRLEQAVVTADRYASPDLRRRGDQMLMEVVTGTLMPSPDDGIHQVQLEGGVHAALFVDEGTGFWYLRLPVHATPQNIAIESQTVSSINGYRAIRMKSAPPRVISVAANGRQHHLIVRMDRRLSHVH